MGRRHKRRTYTREQKLWIKGYAEGMEGNPEWVPSSEQSLVGMADAFASKFGVSIRTKCLGALMYRTTHPDYRRPDYRKKTPMRKFYGEGDFRVSRSKGQLDIQLTAGQLDTIAGGGSLEGFADKGKRIRVAIELAKHRCANMPHNFQLECAFDYCPYCGEEV